jgi:hypothetical protein
MYDGYRERGWGRTREERVEEIVYHSTGKQWAMGGQWVGDRTQVSSNEFTALPFFGNTIGFLIWVQFMSSYTSGLPTIS